MPRWRDRSRRFQNNMDALASDDFGPQPDFEPPAVFNPAREQIEAIAALKELIEGVETGKYLLDNLSISISVDDFNVQSFNAAMPFVVPGGSTAFVEMRIKSNQNVTLDDDYPELGEAPRAQVGASPPRDLILDDGNDD